jgi:hypothetical protein
VLLTACSNDVQISSDSTKFMGEELGKTVSNKGELYYDEDKGCFLKAKNGAIADCLLKTKKVFKISVNCESGKSDASIDGVKCGSSIPSDKQSNSQKLCNESRFDDGYYLKQKNGYFWINSQNKVTELVLVREENYLRNEGEDPYTRQNCIDIKKSKEDARIKKEAELERQGISNGTYICYQEIMTDKYTDRDTKVDGYGMPQDRTGSFVIRIEEDHGYMTAGVSGPWFFSLVKKENKDGETFNTYQVNDRFFKYLYLKIKNGKLVSMGQDTQQFFFSGECL